MVAKVMTHLLTDILPVQVIKSAFSLLPLGGYLLPVTTQTGTNLQIVEKNSFFTTTSSNVSID